MAAAEGRPARLHAGRVRPEQRVHLAALLIAVAVAIPAYGQDISFDPAIAQEEFHRFNAVVSQAIFPNPVAPARDGGLFDFDIGIAATAVPIDDDAAYWVRSVNEDLTTGGYLMVPRVIVSKGILFATVSASYARVPDSDIAVLGGSLDVPIIPGGVLRPTLAVRATYGTLQGVDVYDLRMLGAEAFLSKGFGPVTPYVAAGIVRTEAEGRIVVDDQLIGTLTDEFDQERITVGVRISLLIPKIVIEATEAEERTYAAKVSFGF